MQRSLYIRHAKFMVVLLTMFLVDMSTGLSFATEVFQSGTRRVHVLELYTSEGCSSCPPADRWFSALKGDKRLWHELVPVAFHVDYWNDIGWRDRFSSHIFSDRQRRYARTKGLSTVYTPGFLLDGREWRSFFGLRRLALDKESDAGNLIVKLEQQSVQVSYHSAGHKQSPLVFNIALLGFNLVTRVEAGENHGKQLHHDFAVLGYKTAPLSAVKDVFTGTTHLPHIAIHAPQSGLAVWINNEGDPTPLQATGGWIQ
jgi:hypothetical protein